MSVVRIVIGLMLVSIGLLVFITGVVGIFRLKYVLNRMHAAALGDTLGILFILAGLMVLVGFGFLALRMGLIIVFLWLASPVASHLLAKAEFVTFKHIKQEVEVVEK